MSGVYTVLFGFAICRAVFYEFEFSIARMDVGLKMAVLLQS